MKHPWLVCFALCLTSACGGSTGDNDGSAGSGGSGNAGGTGGSAGAGGSGGVAGATAKECIENGGWCAYTDGTCGQSVDCFCQATRPQTCDPVDYWVCGCDGKEYHGECEAQRAGVDINRSEWTCQGGEYERGACGWLSCANEEVCQATYTDRPEPSSYDCVHVGQCYTCDCLNPKITDPGCKCVDVPGAYARIECQL